MDNFQTASFPKTSVNLGAFGSHFTKLEVLMEKLGSQSSFFGILQNFYIFLYIFP
jgi:hypothetical protein